MARIYVASSWRNKYQPEVVTALRKAGHEVYDFRNPKDNPGGKIQTEIFHQQARISQEAIQEEISKYQIFLNNKRLAPSRS